jgi:CHAD domain-containing protein
LPRSRKRSLLDYLDSLLETLRTVIPDAVVAGETKAVHQARVATRRFRAALNVIDPVSTGPGKKRLGKVLKKLRKNLGQTRDLDVMLAHLTEFNLPRFQTGVQRMQAQLAERSAKSRASTKENLDPDKVISRLAAWGNVRQECVEHGEDSLLGLLAESLHLQLDRFGEQADRQSGRVTAAADQPGIDPHSLRIAGKLLRYSLELAVAGGRKVPARVLRLFKRLQDALGLWHDYIVLTDELLAGSIGLKDATVALSMIEMARESLRLSQRQLGKFNALWTRHGVELAQTIRSAFPLTQAVEPLSQMQTGPDPADLPAPEPAPAEPIPAEPSTA